MHNMIHHSVSACTCNASGLTHAWQSKRGPGRCRHTDKYHQGRSPYLQPGFCQCKMFHGFTGYAPALSHLMVPMMSLLVFMIVLKAMLSHLILSGRRGNHQCDAALAMVPLKANHSCPMSSHKTLKKKHVLYC